MAKEIVIKIPTGEKRPKRFSSDFSLEPLRARQHVDGKTARLRICEKFKGQYKKQEIDTMAYLLMEKIIEVAKIERGTYIEELFDL